MPVTTQASRTSVLERLLVLLAAVVCLIITIVIWLSVSSNQSMWPLPGLYFIEIVTLSVVSAFLSIRGDPQGQFLTWGAAGAIGTFSILAAFCRFFLFTGRIALCPQLGHIGCAKQETHSSTPGDFPNRRDGAIRSDVGSDLIAQAQCYFVDSAPYKPRHFAG